MGCAGSKDNSFKQNANAHAYKIAGSIVAKCFLGWVRFTRQARFARIELDKINAAIKAKEAAKPTEQKESFKSQFRGFRGAHNAKQAPIAGQAKRVLMNVDEKDEAAKINEQIRKKKEAAKASALAKNNWRSTKALSKGVSKAALLVKRTSTTAMNGAHRASKRVSRMSTGGDARSSVGEKSTAVSKVEKSQGSRRSLVKRLSSAGNAMANAVRAKPVPDETVVL